MANALVLIQAKLKKIVLVLAKNIEKTTTAVVNCTFKWTMINYTLSPNAGDNIGL